MPFSPISRQRATTPRASFDFEVSEDKIVQIVDLDHKGSKSVTNDIENVLTDVCQQHEVSSLEGYEVIYRDSDKIWTGVLLSPKGNFADFFTLGGTKDQAQAVARVREVRQQRLAAKR
jgi:hypothetical protein